MGNLKKNTGIFKYLKGCHLKDDVTISRVFPDRSSVSLGFKSYEQRHRIDRVRIFQGLGLFEFGISPSRGTCYLRKKWSNVRAIQPLSQNISYTRSKTRVCCVHWHDTVPGSVWHAEDTKVWWIKRWAYRWIASNLRWQFHYRWPTVIASSTESISAAHLASQNPQPFEGFSSQMHTHRWFCILRSACLHVTHKKGKMNRRQNGKPTQINPQNQMGTDERHGCYSGAFPSRSEDKNALTFISVSPPLSTVLHSKLILPSFSKLNSTFL